ncbi:MAG: preprotein translocase subunit SecA [Myxococcales bacterium]|nr:preprotein translocase subunit SecA [Polyangiaceae bacterium]MDW8249282.1 preprotein translocase subunit SecA [Myxococcales bacterium]
MLAWAIKKIFGTANERAVNKLQPKVEAINAMEERMQKLSDAQLQAKTAEFKQKLSNGASLDDILIEAFAACREASRRVLKMRHYNVQLIGGMVLHAGAIAEMRTGEGKTLVATLPCYLNALEGKGVHVVTVNDYLARRDCEWMSRLYNWMGLTTGVVVNMQDDADKKAAYRADITYGQNNEFGFDYLRDNMKFSALDYCQRTLNYAIVDEVDSILIDEARTPLIISGQGERSSEKYTIISNLIPSLTLDEHYTVDEKAHSVSLTDEGVERIESLLEIDNLYEPEHLETLHILNQCLRAHTLYKRDQHYIVRGGKVLIVDEFTGRILEGRRWSDGLHQAIEAKEGVRIQDESRTMATITFQNLFRLYKKLAGMTGTATTEAAEFHSTYNLDVVSIPTNKPVQRVDYEDVVYKTEREKFNAVVKEIIECHERGQPVLVGTTSVEKSAALSAMLKKRKVPHSVLNAKHHENEAYIVAQAGRKGAITVSTNMAGRGTDILLGGNPEMIAKQMFREQNKLPDAEPEAFQELLAELEKSCAQEREEVKAVGGLHIVGTERHESRRIDNQLRGRAGRQGDPGTSRFYLSLEDDLMRIFAGDRVKVMMDRLGMPDDEPIEHPWVTKSVENAQRKVEERNFDIRKHLLEYDDVMNAQRKRVYALRQQLLIGRYETEARDEDGRSTGKKKVFKPRPEIIEATTPVIYQLVGAFCSPPILPRNEDGSPRTLSREDLKQAASLSNLEQLQREIYQAWGVKIEVEGRETDVLGILDELLTSVPQALTEQRERLFDLIDEVICSAVEKNCPANKPPEDWDWTALHEAMADLFGIDAEGVEELAEQERVAEFLYKAAEKQQLSREKALGIELSLRVFRHIYLEEIDRAWVDHLTNMDHLRDGIGLRGYGQKDPKQEYKKEGYNLFVNMMASISEQVVRKMLHVEVHAPEEEAMIEQADLLRHQEALAHALASHGADQEPALPGGEMPIDAPILFAPEEPRISMEEECPCGSGKPFRSCHGAPEAFAS